MLLIKQLKKRGGANTASEFLVKNMGFFCARYQFFSGNTFSMAVCINIWKKNKCVFWLFFFFVQNTTFLVKIVFFVLKKKLTGIYYREGIYYNQMVC